MNLSRTGLGANGKKSGANPERKTARETWARV